MRNDLLRSVELEDLSGADLELAELIGIEAWRKLVDTYGGTGRLYIPQADMVVIPIRNKLIQREYDGTNLFRLTQKWGLTERTISEIVREKAKQIRLQPPAGQMSFDDLQTQSAS